MAPVRNAGTDAAAPAVARDHSAGGHQVVLHNRAVDRGGEGRLGASGARALQAHLILGVYPRAEPVAHPLNDRAGEALHTKSVAAPTNNRDV